MHRRDMLISTLAGSAALAFAPRAAAGGQRDWAALAREDLKPIQPNLANVHAARGKHQKAVEVRHQILRKYPFAQYWDDKDGLVRLAEVVKATDNQIGTK